MAHVDIRTDQANADLDRLEQRVKDLERNRHHIRLDAVFDQSSIGRARQMFAQLDNAISRDAANRLRSSPQGSVLGALNSLFSPHPVTGAPTATQSAQSGLLGRLAGGQATGAATPGGSTMTGPAPRNYPQQQAQAQQEEKQQTQLLRDIADTNRQQTQSGNRTAGLLAGLLHGGGGGGGGGLAAGGLLAHLLGGGGGGGSNLRWHLGTGGAGISGNFGGRLLGGIGPSILGMGLKTTGIIGGGGALLGALPGLLGPTAALGLGGIGLGAGLAGFKAATSTVSPLVQQSQQIQQQLLSATGTQRTQLLAQQAQIQKSVAGMAAPMQSLFASMNSIENRWQNIGQSIAPAFVKPLATVATVFRQLTPLISSTFRAGAALITPFVKGLGDMARMVLPLLIQGFRIVAPAIRPLMDGLGKLVAGILPGLNSIVRASLPIIKPFGSILGMLGRDIGGLFGAMAPAVKASEPIFRALMAVLGAIFPIIGKVAAEFAKVLGPVFVSLAKTIQQLLPILKPVGMLIAQLAAAILADLGSAFQAVLILIRDMEPSIRILAGALGSVFKVLENSGVFAIMGNALEKIAPILAQLVNTLVKAFAPVLPVIIQLVSQMATILTSLLAAGLTVVLQGVADLVKWLAPLIKWIGLAVIAEYAFGAALAFVAANPVVAIIGGIVLLIGAIVELVKHWSTVWATIKHLASDAWNFIWNGFGKFLLPLLGPVGLIALGALELYQHWKTIWNGITGAAKAAWNFLVNDVWDPLQNFLTSTLPGWLDDAYHFWLNNFIDPWKNALQSAWNWVWNNVWDPIDHFLHNTLPGWFDDAVKAIGIAWHAVEDAVKAPINFVIRYILNDGLIKAFDWISSKVGGPHIDNIPTLRSGGTIPGWGGGDKVLAALEPGETVVPKEHSKGLAWLWKMLGIPGYQAGGTAPRPGGPQAVHTGIGVNTTGGGDIFSVFKKIYDTGRILAALGTGNNTALDNAFYALMGHGVGGAVGDMAALLLDIPKTLVHDAVKWLISQFTASMGAPGGGGPGFLHTGVPAEGPVQDYAKRLLAAYGWASQWFAFNDIVMRESGWRVNAQNPSGAYGIPQALPGDKMASAGADWRTNPYTQLRWMMGYLRSRWGSPDAADANERANHWYDQGGWLPPGGSMSWNQTRRREAVLTPAQSEAFIAVGEAARLFARGTGNIGTGSLMRDVYLTLPEGTTVAQALAEITFRLRTAQMNGYAGVVPGG